MKCYFCQQPIDVPTDGSDAFCWQEQHGRIVTHRISNQVVEFVRFDCHHNHKNYAIFCWLSESNQIAYGTHFSIYQIKFNNANFNYQYDFIEVMSLPFHPQHITPDNISRKISTLLTFS